VVQNADPLEIGFIVNISARMTERTGHYRRLTEDDVGDLELAAANGLHESLQGIIRQAQQEWHTDVLRVIPNLRAKKPSVWSQVNWPEEFSQTDIHVDQVSVHITDTGEVR
jgi:2-oxo-4-hydroxy-4-carboxy--5-ureidoimidazoline (OHCU) decarboxylase